ncbi:MAG TPA: hypothetical protein VKI64_03100, partial [Acidimicrobiales bacterium]|nr:hypothetical protein [Acidimicrobiales bacterium]
MSPTRVTLASLAAGSALLVAVLVQASARPANLGADSGYMYGYLPSVVLHHDLDFSDDALPFDSSMPHTATGRAHNVFPMGPAMLWAPGFVAGHAVAATARLAAVRSGPAADGRSWPYDVLVGLAGLWVGVLAVWATFALARRWASTWAATLATVAIWVAGPLVYYTHVEPMRSHAPAVASVALLLLLWLRVRDRPGSSLWPVAALGTLGGVVALSRWQNGVFLLGPAIDAARGHLRQRRAPDAAALFLMAGTAVAVFSPQLLVWNSLYGSPFRAPSGGGFLDLHRLHVVDVLFSWRHGLLSWHPVLAVGLAGLLLAARRRPLPALSLLGAFVLTTLIN